MNFWFLLQWFWNMFGFYYFDGWICFVSIALVFGYVGFYCCGCGTFLVSIVVVVGQFLFL
jgi:hypothetical protein